MSEKRRAWVFLILLLAAAVRGLGVTAESLWSDETFVAVARRTVPLEAVVFDPDEPTPPLYLVTMRGWMSVAGTGELAMRWPSVLAGVLTVAVLYAIARQLWPRGRSAALAAASLLALAPMHVWYSQEARTYALETLCVAAAGLAGLSAARRGEGTPWAAYALGMLLALYCHYAAVLGLIAVGGLLLWQCRRARCLRNWGLAHGAIALGYAAWLPQLAQHVRFAFSPVWLTQYLDALYGYTGVRLGIQQFAVVLGAAVLLMLAVAVAAIRLLPRAWRWAEQSPRTRRVRDGGAALLWLGAWLALVVWAVLGRALTAQRVILVLVPWMLLGTAAALARIWASGARGRAAALTCAVVSAAAVGYLGVTLQKEDWRGAVALVAQREQPGDGVYLLPAWSWHAFEEYYAGTMIPRGLPNEGVPDTMLPQFARFSRIWVVLYNGNLVDPAGRVGAWFDDRFRRMETYQFRLIELRLYEE